MMMSSASEICLACGSPTETRRRRVVSPHSRDPSVLIVYETWKELFEQEMEIEVNLFSLVGSNECYICRKCFNDLQKFVYMQKGLISGVKNAIEKLSVRGNEVAPVPLSSVTSPVPSMSDSAPGSKRTRDIVMSESPPVDMSLYLRSMGLDLIMFYCFIQIFLHYPKKTKVCKLQTPRRKKVARIAARSVNPPRSVASHCVKEAELKHFCSNSHNSMQMNHTKSAIDSFQ